MGIIFYLQDLQSNILCSIPFFLFFFLNVCAFCPDLLAAATKLPALLRHVAPHFPHFFPPQFWLLYFSRFIVRFLLHQPPAVVSDSPTVGAPQLANDKNVSETETLR